MVGFLTGLQSYASYLAAGGFFRQIALRFGEQPSVLDYIPTTYHAAIKAKTQSNPMDTWLQQAMDLNEIPVTMPVGLYPCANRLSVATQGRGLVGAGEGYGLLNSVLRVTDSAATRLKWIGDSVRTVSAITQTNPGQITLTADAPASWVTGTKFAFRAITAGMTQLSGVMGALTKIDSRNFTIGIDTTAFGVFSGTATITEGEAFLVARPGLNDIALSGLTFSGFQLDCNNFSIPGINFESVSNCKMSRLLVYAPNGHGVRTGNVPYALTSPFGAYGHQHTIWEQVFVSMLAGSGEYLISPAKGFILTSGSAVNTGNTSFDMYLLCRAHTAKGRPWYLESCDDNWLIGCIGQAVRDTSVAAIEFASSTQDPVSLDGGAARYNTILGFNGSAAKSAISRNGPNPAHDNVFLALSRANNQTLPDIEAGSSLWYTDTNANTNLASSQTITTDTGFTLTVGTSPFQTFFDGVLTAARGCVLSTTGATPGARFRISRRAASTGAFNLNVGTGPLKGLATGTWCEVFYDGTAWTLTAYGSL